MRGWVAAPIAVVAALHTPASASADPGVSEPLVERAEWVQWVGLPSLRVYPTPSGRAAAGDVGTAAQGIEAWSQLVTLVPDADTPGMREQFICHWQWAEFTQPGKISWNLEPWRPVVDDGAMLAAGCNPGGTEEPF